MRWVRKIRDAIRFHSRSADPVEGVKSHTHGEDCSGEDCSREQEGKPYQHGLAEPFRGRKTSSPRRIPAPLCEETDLHEKQHDVETNAQRCYGTFEVVIRNDLANNTYQQTVDGDYDALMYSALILLEYMGHMDEQRVMLACSRLTNAARAYHKKHNDRLATNARKLFAGAKESGVLDIDFL